MVLRAVVDKGQIMSENPLVLLYHLLIVLLLQKAIHEGWLNCF